MERKIWGNAAKYLAGRRRRLRWHKVVTALASVVVFCTTYVLILPAITLTVDEGWMNNLAEEHVYINCPGAALYMAASFGGAIVPGDSGSGENDGPVVEVTEPDTPLAENPDPPDEGTDSSPATEPSPSTQNPDTPATPETPVTPEPPATPEDPETPVTPEDPETPVTPEDPETPETPENPETPVTPETPENPENPGNPETPENPETPVTPETPETSENPETPETPENPETPETPENPETPETPENPETPETPENPETPETPENPETPEIPENPETPETPENPETPETPETPENPEKPEQPEVHEHTDACYGENGELICTEGEEKPEQPEVHKHTEACYDENGELICTEGEEKPELPELPHVHTEDCYEVNEDGESVLVCTEEGGHVHTAEKCLDENGEVTCGFEDYFPEDYKLVEVPINRTFTFGLTRYTVTGTIKLPKGMTEDDLFDMLFSAEESAAAADMMSLDSAGLDMMDADGLTEINEPQVPLAEDAELDNETKLALIQELLYSVSTLSMEAQTLTSGELPHTGGMGLPVWYAMGGTLTAAAALALAKGKKEEA